MPKTHKARAALIAVSMLGASATTAAREPEAAPAPPPAADPATVAIGGHGLAPPTRCLRA